MMAMMRYASRRSSVVAAPRPAHGAYGRYGGSQYALLPASAPRTATVHVADEPVTFRAVAPRLRPLVARYNSRCPECTGPLVSGEGAVACPVCGFRRLG